VRSRKTRRAARVAALHCTNTQLIQQKYGTYSLQLTRTGTLPGRQARSSHACMDHHPCSRPASNQFNKRSIRATPRRDPKWSACVCLDPNGQTTRPNVWPHPQIMSVLRPSRSISKAKLVLICGQADNERTGTRLLLVRLGDAWRPSTYLHHPK
jgi:hypothetical protein